MGRTCKKDSIYRKAYTRTSPSGKKSRVKGACIRSVSLSGKKRSVINRRIISAKKASQRKAAVATGSAGLKCPPGSILRAAYFRQSFTRADGTVVTKSRAAAKCIKSRGTGRRNAVIGPLQRGSLAQFGYTKVENLSEVARNTALDRAVATVGFLPIIKKLNALYVLNRNVNNKLAAIFKRDQQRLSKLYMQLPSEERLKAGVRR